MKFLRLDLRAFGPFTAVSLDLSAGNHGFHLVYGPNEAGKSSALRALGNLLYGIPGNTADDFIHNKPGLRIGALLARRDGEQLEIVRRKGNKGTLLPPDEKAPLEESVLHSFLGGCDEAQFKTMFGIDHGGLIAGGQEIIRGQGDIGHVLFAAGAGISDLRTIRSSLEREANDLFRPGGLKPAVNMAISELNRAKKLIRDTQLPSGDWQKHKVELVEKQKQLAELEARLAELSRQKTRLERLTRALPTLARLRECDEQLARMGDVPTLPAEFTEKRRATIADLETARRSEHDASAEIDRLDQLLAEVAVPEGMISRAEQIEAVYKELGVYRKAQNDLPGLIVNREHLEREAGELLRELRPDLKLADAGQLKLARRQQIEIQNLGNRKEVLDAQLVQAQSEIAAGRRRLADTCDELARLPPPFDPTALAEAIRQARSKGNLSQQVSALRAEIVENKMQASIDLCRLGLWSGSLEALEVLALPETETIDRFDSRLSEAQAAITRVEGALEKARNDVTGIERELDRLRLEGEVPAETDLAEARKHRDAGWQLVRQAWRKEAIGAADLQSFLAQDKDGLSDPNVGAEDLASAYEQAVRRTDDLSDRLRREANRVANRASLTAQHISFEQQIRELTSLHATTLERLQETEAEWRQAWQPAGIEPLPPPEMRAWMQRQGALVQKAQTIRLRTASLAQLKDQIAASCRQLQSSLDAVSQALQRGASSEFQSSPVDLDLLLARGDSILEKIKETADARRQLEREKNRLRASAVEAETKAAQAEKDLAAWRSQWTAAIRPLGLAEETSPIAVNEVVAQTAELSELLSKADGFSERINGIQRDARRFRESVEKLLASICPEQPPPGDHFEQVLEDVVARVRQAISDQKKRDLLAADRNKQVEIRCLALSAIEKLEMSLAQLCHEARCQSPEGFPAAENASAAVVRLRQDREACVGQLLQLAAGATIDALVAETAELPADSLPGELQRIADAISELDFARGEVREAIGGEKRVLDGMDSSSEAAFAAEDVQEILARLEPDVRHYLRLRLASAVLREGIERYRKKNEGPVLGRASELFHRLTLGSFDALRIDFGERDEQLLAGVRPDGKTVLPTAMSEGTCDQLYLALRLASLETWLARNEPMPFIVDDILVSFDNRRAAATLEVLAELSARTQVIFFSHHEHLVDLAQECIPGDVLFVHRL
jgi:uncharacterized protein YhaN